MSETKHTPGPWTLEPNGPGYNLKSPNFASHFCILLGMNGKPDGEHEANARLIAAAPDLLKACQEAVGWLLIGAPHAHSHGGLITDQLAAAIAQADGRSSRDCLMKIQGKTLDKSDVGRSVRYIPGHAQGVLSHHDIEDGKITSWNEVNVFVDYGHGSHPATCPRDLIWG